jgi:serine protease Do
MDQLINKGRVVRGWLGVQIQRVDEELAESYDLKDVTGVLIASVTDNSPAEKAGVEPGDIVLKVNDEKMETLEQLQNTIASYPPDEKVELTIWRDGKRKTLTVKLGERPGQEELASSRSGEKPTSMSTELGFEVQALTDDLARRLGYEDDEGVLVSDVKRNSVADREGIREGDLITSVNRRPIKSIRDFNQEMDKLKEDDIVLFRIKREDVNLFAALRVPKN